MLINTNHSFYIFALLKELIMDPNFGKKNMFNKLSKEQCLVLLEKETFNRITVSFYRYIILENLPKLRDHLYDNWKELEVLGRIYILKKE